MNLSLEQRIARMEAAIEIQNLVGTYECYHTASMQQECYDLFADRPDISVEYDLMGKWEGRAGVRRFFLGFLASCEEDLTGRLYQHDNTSPIIQVAEDGQTAKALFSSIGLETPKAPDGLHSLWAWYKVAYDFIKQDGSWKIWHQRWYTTFITSYERGGWSEEPLAGVYTDIPIDMDAPHLRPDTPPIGAKPYSNTTADFNLHNLIPAPPSPYETWDE